MDIYILYVIIYISERRLDIAEYPPVVEALNRYCATRLFANVGFVPQEITVTFVVTELFLDIKRVGRFLLQVADLL